MNTYHYKVTISAPTDKLLQEILNSSLLSQEEFEHYNKEHKMHYWIIDVFEPYVVEPCSASFHIHSRGYVAQSFYFKLLELYPTVSLDIISWSNGYIWDHYKLSSEGIFEIFNEEEFRYTIEDELFDCDSVLDDYEFMYYSVIPEFREWKRKLGRGNEKVYGDVIPFPEDLIPDSCKVAWHRDPETFKKEITTIVEACHRLEALNKPEPVSLQPSAQSDDDRDDLPF